MNSAEPNLGKEAIDHRFVVAVMTLVDREIVVTQGEVAQALGVKPAKFSEIMNGRMHVGVDMIAELSEEYYVSPEWLLTGRGDFMFRRSTMLPQRLSEDDLITEHPYMIEDEDEMMRKREEKIKREEEEKREKVITPTLLSIISDKDKLMLQQAEEIGRLKAEIEELKRKVPTTSNADDVSSAESALA